MAAVDSGPPPNPLHRRAARLFRYLKELVGLRSKVRRDVAEYEAVFWFGDVPREPECYVAAWDGGENAGSEEWLRIDKPAKPRVPKPPAECDPWIALRDLENPSVEPTLRTEIIDPASRQPETAAGDITNTDGQILVLKNFPLVSKVWEKYLRTEWRSWSTQLARWDRVQKVYRALFAIFQEQERRGEQYELVVGVGVFSWTTSSGHKIRRPILTGRIAITLDSKTGRITIEPAADGADFKIEHDMLAANERPPVAEQQAIEEQVAALETLWDRSQVTPLLKRWLHSLTSAADAEFYDVMECATGSSNTPKMSYSPLLILRKRGARTLVDALEKIVTAIAHHFRTAGGAVVTPL